MPKQPKDIEWPEDPNEAAVLVGKIATGEIADDTAQEDELTEEQRAEIARKPAKDPHLN